jgi:hypothetical protein
MSRLEDGRIFGSRGRCAFREDEGTCAEEGAVGLDTEDEIAAGGELLEKIRDRARRTNGDSVFACRDLQARGKKRLQGGDNLSWCEGGAIGEFDARTEFELPGFEGRVVRPIRGERRLEVTVVVESEEAVIEESGEFCVFSGGDRAGFPFAWIEGDLRDLQFEAERAAIDGVFGGEEIRRGE